MTLHETPTPRFRTRVNDLHALAILLLMIVAGCAGGAGDNGVSSSGDPEADLRAEQRISSDGKTKTDRTLYERFGGAETITALVDDMTTRTIADPRVNFERKNVRTNVLGAKYDAWDPSPSNVEQFKRHMVEFLTLAAGGPAEYTGGDVRAVHKGMKITNNEFDAMVGDIKASMDKLGIPTREKRDLLAIVETTRKQIVEEP
jgi:hemoglobin